MKTQIEVTEDVPVKQWEQMIQNSPTSSFFYTPNWAAILRETYGYQTATTLFEMDGTEILVPMMESTRFFFSSLESIPLGYGGFVSPDILSPALIQRVIKKIANGRNLSLSITLPPFTKTTPPEDFQIHKIQTDWDYTHVLPLDFNYEQIQTQFKKAVRKRIKMVEASDLTVRITNDLQDYRSLYDLYVRRSEEWGYAKPPHPWTLYKNLQHHGGQHVVLRIAEMNGLPIGGAITLEYGTNAFLWMIISPAEYMHHYPTYLLLQDIIQSLCERGFTFLNQGGSGKLDGVRLFKESFGGVKVPICSYEAYSLLGKIFLRRQQRVWGKYKYMIP